jgi:hypothetical protein
MRRVGKARRYGPLVAWVVAFVIVRTAIQDHGYRWTWILLGLLVLFGAGRLLAGRRRGPVETSAGEPHREIDGGRHVRAPSTSSVIGFQRGMLWAMGALGVALSALCAWGAVLVFADLAQNYWLGVLLGTFMVFGFGLFLWWVVFAARGLLGRSALILDANGLTDQSSPIPLGRVAWDDVEAIHWQWPGSLLATRQIVAVDRRNGLGAVERSGLWRRGANLLRSRGLDTAKLAVSDEELAHEFRRYSGGRFGIRRR